MKYLSLFSGIGGFELGIHQAYESIQELRDTDSNLRKSAGATRSARGRDKQHNFNGAEGLSCIGFSEIDKYAIQIYQKHYPSHKNYGDVTKIKEKELPDFDLLVGGFPCQSFSIAGKRRGFADTRGTLFFEICRILKQKQPRLILLENVKGLLSHDEGRTFAVIITALDDLGYDCQWQVLNSKDFGVPQNRERIFIVGHLRGTSRPEVFPFFRTGEKIDDSERTVQQIGKRNHSNSNTQPFQQDRVYDIKGISPALQQALPEGSHKISIGTLRTHKDGQGFRKVQSGLAPTIPARAREDGSGQGVIMYPHGGNPGGLKKLPNLRAHSGAVHNEVLYPQIRRLTPVECERLQGFPDGWTEGVSDTQRYKCLGNAVTVNVIQAIVEQMI